MGVRVCVCVCVCDVKSGYAVTIACGYLVCSLPVDIFLWLLMEVSLCCGHRSAC